MYYGEKMADFSRNGKTKNTALQSIEEEQDFDLEEQKNTQDPKDMEKFFIEIYGHLSELHRRLWLCSLWFFCCFVFCYIFVDYPMGLLVKPLGSLLKTMGGKRLIYTSLTEAFLTYLRCGFFSALILTLPVLVYHLWGFFSPGLKKRERGSLGWFIFCVPVFFIWGALMAYYWICPMAWSFFLSYEKLSLGGIPLVFEGKIADYISLMLNLMTIFGLGFQLPVFIFVLHGFHLVSYEILRKSRGYVLVAITIFAAISTPPDILSPLGFIVPVYGLYEATLLVLRFYEKN